MSEPDHKWTIPIAHGIAGLLLGGFIGLALWLWVVVSVHPLLCIGLPALVGAILGMFFGDRFLRAARDSIEDGWWS